MNPALSAPTAESASAQRDVVAGLRRFTSVCALFQATVRASPEQIAFRRHGSSGGSTWREAAEQVRRLAGGLAAIGVGARGATVGTEDVVALLLPNVPEFHIADLAVLHAGAAPFSLYVTDPGDRMGDLLDAAGAQVLITDSAGLARAKELLAGCARLSTVVVMGATERCDTGEVIDVDSLADRAGAGFDIDAAAGRVGPDSTACLIYTSGTTGAPKGVQLPHRAMLASVAQYVETAPFTPHGRVLSYLPAAHIADRWAAHYTAIAGGHTVTCVPDPSMLDAAILDTRPTHFFTVPRMLEKLTHRAVDVLETSTDLAARHAGRLARIRSTGEVVPSRGPSPFASVHESLGLDATEWLTVGSAPSAQGYLESMAALDLPFADTWGLTEIIVCAMNPPERMKLGTIGRALPGIRFRVEDGELLAAGPTAFTGYRGDPERTREMIDADGWIRTGDLAEIDPDGYVRIVGRKKEMIINSAGKNMSPLTIEGAIKTASALIEHVAVAGDGRRYVVALISLEPRRLRAFADRHGLTDGYAALTRHPTVLAEVEAGVQRGNDTLSRVEHVRAWRVVEEEWQPGGDEVTASMKLMRANVLRKYAELVEELYEPSS